MKMKFIKNRIRLYLAYFLYLVSSAIFPWLKRKYFGKTRVIVFHHIDSEKSFRRIVKAIADRYNLISYGEYLDGKVSREKINVIMALDDGYLSWFEKGLPVFREFKVGPLLFVNSDFVGLPAEDAFDYCRDKITTWPEATLTWDQLRELVDLGAEVGGHSLDHADLSVFRREDDILQAIADDRLAIARRTGNKPRCFTYPFGRYGLKAMHCVEKAGYQYAFSSDSGFLDDSISLYSLNRSNVGLRPPGVVCAVIEGWGDKVSKWVKLIKSYSGP